MRLCDALNMDVTRLATLFGLGGETLTTEQVSGMLRDSKQGDAIPCKNTQMLCFLEGFIIEQRGPKEAPEAGTKAPAEPARMSNNLVLKKLRIALQLKERETVAILAAGGTEVTPRQLGALGRKRGNKHYRTCPDDVLRSFLTGLASA
jgi:uncharacterized protein YehS (DUF1456 family)